MRLRVPSGQQDFSMNSDSPPGSDRPALDRGASSASAASTSSRVVTDNGDEVVLTHAPLDESYALRFVRDPAAGATCLFVGTTRDSFEGKTVTSLEYEAYSKVALRSMKEIIQRARQGQLVPPVAERAVRSPDCGKTVTRVYLAHRLGTVATAESSIIVAVSSPHRRESFEVAEWLLEQVKREVPIWKQEQYAGDANSPVWKANFAPSPAPRP